MSKPTHLVDLIDLPPLQRRMVQLLLRKGIMLEHDLYQSLSLVAQEHVPRTVFDHQLAALIRVGWLLRDTDGDEPRYRIPVLPRRRMGDDSLAQRLDWNSMSQQWDVRLPPARRNTLPSSRVTSTLTALAEPEVKPEGLMQRGGKRTLPGAIWDKLESDPLPVKRPSRASLLDDLFDKSDEPSNEPKSD